MKKKTPRSPNKKRKKAKETQENILIIGIFVVFIVVVAYSYYFVTLSSSNEAVAVVNGNEITRDELDFWYKVTVVPEFRDVIKKQDFLMLSLIPQELLLQQAKKANIRVTNDDIEELLGLYIIENGMTLDEFDNHLNSRGITLDDIKISFETRAFIIKLLEKEDIFFTSGPEFFEGPDRILQEYVDDLIENAKIEIFSENIDKLVLRSFEATGDDVCGEEKPIVRLYTTTKCEVCKETGRVFQDTVIKFIADESIQARHWSLDTGDNLLTLKKEKGIPQKEFEIFKKYSPKKLVPTVVLGCKYKMIGSFGAEEEEEFKILLKTLTGE